MCLATFRTLPFGAFGSRHTIYESWRPIDRSRRKSRRHLHVNKLGMKTAKFQAYNLHCSSASTHDWHTAFKMINESPGFKWMMKAQVWNELWKPRCRADWMIWQSYRRLQERTCHLFSSFSSISLIIRRTCLQKIPERKISLIQGCTAFCSPSQSTKLWWKSCLESFWRLHCTALLLSFPQGEINSKKDSSSLKTVLLSCFPSHNRDFTWERCFKSHCQDCTVLLLSFPQTETYPEKDASDLKTVLPYCSASPKWKITWKRRLKSQEWSTFWRPASHFSQDGHQHWRRALADWVSEPLLVLNLAESQSLCWF